MDLKSILGDKYSETMTLADVDRELANMKLVDLNGSIKYVVKDKFDKLEREYNDYKEATKDYETVKESYVKYQQAEQNEFLKKELLTAGVNPKFADDVLYRIEKGVIKNEEGKLADNVKEFLKANPHYAGTTQPQQQPVIISTRGNALQGQQVVAEQAKTFNQEINQTLRGLTVSQGK